MPSFGDLQLKTTLYPTQRTRLTVFGLAGREMLSEVQKDPGEVRPHLRRATEGDNRIAAGTLRWMPSSRFSSATTVSAYSTSSRYEDRQLSGFSDFRPSIAASACGTFALRQQIAVRHVKGIHDRCGRRPASGAHLVGDGRREAARMVARDRPEHLGRAGRLLRGPDRLAARSGRRPARGCRSGSPPEG